MEEVFIRINMVCVFKNPLTKHGGKGIWFKNELHCNGENKLGCIIQCISQKQD